MTLSFDEALEGITLPLRLTTRGAVRRLQRHRRAQRHHAARVPDVRRRRSGQPQRGRLRASPRPCRSCRGRGLVVDDPCPACSGSGHAPSTRTVQARIPAGVRNGSKIRLRGKGAPGEFGGEAGDLLVAVKVTPHPVFGRDGDNLTVHVPITFDEAALGADISVPVPDGGPVKLRLAEGTQSGRVMRVRGRGVRRKDGTRGDLLVTVEVVVPQRLSAGAARRAVGVRRGLDGSGPAGRPRRARRRRRSPQALGAHRTEGG